MRFLIKFAYDGTAYNGFQTQPNLDTIQERMENALKIINNGKKTNLVATGRTDKGVHALCQYAHADIDVDINEYKLKRAMNSNLPNDIHVIETKIVSEDFHARYNVKSKEYKYYINLGEYNPLERNYVFQYNYILNKEAMEEAIKVFLGTHDFRAFVTESKEKENCVRTISFVNVEQEDNKLIITFRGDGFLRYQVRNMVGLLIRVGENKISTKDVEKILLSKDRTTTGKTAPAEGLYLTDVTY
ncbi:MAG: tRNA pseudouridine(38-40) synthase TruA [Bacilli bacterium]|nr:tRNA pseudouridine(38-40) synthase TruA [Bacilli bacterium]